MVGKEKYDVRNVMTSVTEVELPFTCESLQIKNPMCSR